MALEFKVPELGENVEKGDVVRVMVKAGDVIAVDQAVFELETDKATIEVPSTVAGTVGEVRIKQGDKVKPGQVVLTFAAASGAGQSSESRSPEVQGAVGVQGSGSHEIPESKAPAAVVNIATARPVAAAVVAAAPVVAAGPVELALSIPAAPSVRRFARELGVEIAQVTGTGPGGRIGQDDVSAYVKGQLTSGGSTSARAHVALPDFSKWGVVESKPMSNIRRKTAEHLSQAWQAPHVTQNDKADLSGFDSFRDASGARVEKAGGKLTITAVVIKVLAAAIDRFPQFASSVDMANEAIVYKQYRHIGVAVDTPSGLLVPVIRDANAKTVTQIAVELAAVSQKARDKKLSLDDMSGGVMTVTNLGGIGGTSFTPIVNRPEVAILGMSRSRIEPVWHDGQFVPRPMLPLSLSYDHRVIDGADAARFLRFVVEALEQPLTMIL